MAASSTVRSGAEELMSITTDAGLKAGKDSVVEKNPFHNVRGEQHKNHRVGGGDGGSRGVVGLTAHGLELPPCPGGEIEAMDHKAPGREAN